MNIPILTSKIRTNLLQWHSVAVLVLIACLSTSSGCGGEKATDGSGETKQNASSTSQADSDAAAAEVLPDLPPYFEEVAESLGIQTQLKLGKVDDYFFPDIMCGGAAFLDANLDGLLDLIVVHAGSNRSMSVMKAGSNPSGRNQIFIQQPDGTFLDFTEESGLGDESYGMGVAVGDLNNDGLPDVYFSNFGPDRLYLNQGDGRFQDVTEQAGIDNPHWSASTCLLDVNRDGWLDIYVTNYVDYHSTDQCFLRDEAPDFCSPNVFNPVADRLFINRGWLESDLAKRDNASDDAIEKNLIPNPAPQFVNASQSAGIAQTRAPGLGVVVGDWNQDGWPDLYVANDGAANQLWMNEQDQTFTDQAVLRGCAFDNSGKAQAGMGIAVSDVDGNQQQDILVTHLDKERNALYLGNSLGSFEDAANRFGIGSPSQPTTGFGAVFADLELDGDADLVTVHGRVTTNGKTGESNFWARYQERNHLFLNRENQKLERVTSRNEVLTTSQLTSRALCKGDIDNDGKIDLFVVNVDGPAQLFRNQARDSGHWVGLQLLDSEFGNRNAIGAKVVLHAGGKTRLFQVGCDGSYCSSHDPRLSIGLGDVSEVEHLEITWPNGQTQVLNNLAIDQYHTIEKPAQN